MRSEKVLPLCCLLLMAGAVAGEVRIGPWGGSGGNLVDLGSASVSRIQRIRINHGDVVDRLTILYTAVNGSSIEFFIGGTGGRESKFELADGEHITDVSGAVNYDHYGITCVGQLSFNTSRGVTYGPYGLGGGRPPGHGALPFTMPIPQGMRVANFFGRGLWYVYSIGAYLDPL